MPSSSSARAIAAAIGTAAAIGAVVTSLRRRRLEAKKSRERLQKNCRKIALLPKESSFVLRVSDSTSSLTFFEASSPEDAQAAKEFLHQRTKDILAANPWLGGFLDNDSETGELALYVPASKTQTNLSDDKIFSILDTNETPLPKDYNALLKSLKPALCGNTDEALAALADTGLPPPLWKVTFIPNAGSGPTERDFGIKTDNDHGFAVVVSANHSILDGHGYYQIYNMLSSKEKVVALDPTRNPNLEDPIRTAMGGEPTLLEAPPTGFILSFLLSCVREALFPQTVSMGFLLSKAWISQHKTDYQHSMNESDAANLPPYLSTNDLIVSHFCQTMDCDLALMAINLRGRVEGCTDQLMGNYEDLIAYRREDVRFPVNIRKSVEGPPFVRTSFQQEQFSTENKTLTRLPTQWEHLTQCKYAAITNWATFAKEIVLEPNGTSTTKSRCAQNLHIPLFDMPKAAPACNWSSMVIFRPRAGEIGAIISGKEAAMEAVRQSGIVGTELYSPASKVQSVQME